ncbi:replication protein A 70 kDa DNA-binding subunit B-like [Juglans regia]|uniref:Replication protein A 70 kDa DNA-binding subunit B-like n=1 Tax=Juglans regia TaxID=51240 RepID=A0A6P9EM94_JUGRE|nr:replication protein A 70 kDa DNA-binding subunit B-like [Juglans regia]
MTAYGPTTIQEIYVIDESLNPICLTMWGKFVQDECQKISEIIEDKPIILGTKISVRSRNGLSLSSRPSSTFTINPILPEAATMKKWADDNDLIIKSIIARNLTYPSAPLSSVGIREIVKNCDIAELIKGLQPMEKLKIWIEAKIKVIDLDQIFYYMSCVGCNKGTGYKYNESFVCMYCKNQGVCKPRARAYVELDDNTGKIAAIMFGEVAEEAFGCSAIELMENSGEEHQPYIKSVADKLSTKIWKIQVYADPEKLNEKRHKHFNVLSIEAMEDERNDGSSS